MIFEKLRPLLRIAGSLEQIASALCYFAREDARRSGRIFMPPTKGMFRAKDESELLHTNDYENAVRREEEFQAFLQRGGKAYEQDDVDE